MTHFSGCCLFGQDPEAAGPVLNPFHPDLRHMGQPLHFQADELASLCGRDGTAMDRVRFRMHPGKVVNKHNQIYDVIKGKKYVFLFRALKQPRNDIIAIAIETGIQNTGMSIFILWFTLDHPLGDITGTVPCTSRASLPI